MATSSDAPGSGVPQIDVKLLKLFDEIHRTRSVSRAAEALGQSQPTVSIWLARLREELRDPLFVRAGGGVQPTAKASQLAESGLPEERRVGAPPLRTDER